ncbi:MAG: hypothetical protein ACXACI_07635 [Candidatus Hodarchaeales archaeon]
MQSRVFPSILVTPIAIGALSTLVVLKIREFCDFREVQVIGEIHFDPTVGIAIANGRTVIEENKDASASIALVQIWERIKREFLHWV